MWPWSTIRRLKERERSLLNRLYEMQARAENAEQGWTGLNESFEELERHARTAESLLKTEAAKRQIAEEKLRLLTTRGPGGRFVKPTGQSSGELGH